jgi:hypothetical protein
MKYPDEFAATCTMGLRSSSGSGEEAKLVNVLENPVEWV